MSRNEWEEGTVIVPSKAWPAFKEGLRKAWNARQEWKRGLAAEMHAALLALGKGKREFDWNAGLGQLLDMVHEGKAAGVRRLRDEADASDANAVAYLVLPYERRKLLGSAGGPLVPRLKDLPDANGATRAFDLGEASITLDEKARSLTWSVAENNHAVERARAHPIATRDVQVAGGGGMDPRERWAVHRERRVQPGVEARWRRGELRHEPLRAEGEGPAGDGTGTGSFRGHGGSIARRW